MSANTWEEVKKGGDAAIEKWIAANSTGLLCRGAETANHTWVIDEIVKSWNLGMGVVGIRVHSRKDCRGRQSQPV